MLTRVASYLKKGVFPVSRILSTVGIGVLSVLALIMVADVFGRRVLNTPITGIYEITSLSMVLIVFLSLAHCASRGGHVEMNIITERLPKHAQSIIVAIMYVFTTAILGVASWRLLIQAIMIQRTHQTAGILEISIYPFVYIATLGCILLTLVYLIITLNALEDARRK